MTEEEKRQVAVFRFGVIHELVNRMDLDRGEQERLIRDKCLRKWDIPFSERSRIGRGTLLRWIKLYRKSGGRLESLYPRDRADRGESRAMDRETLLSLIRLREEFPRLKVASLIEKMFERGLVSAGIGLSRTTVYRTLHRHGVMRVREPMAEDRRRFEADLANEIWQSDVMHGPAVKVDGKMRKSYLVAFLDDHSRLVPHAQFYLSENLACFMDAFEKALSKRGLPRKLYVDNGAAFRSRQLEHVCASLGIALVHARPYKPQGKGKIERFFRSVREGFLEGFAGESPEDLNSAFGWWLRESYHERKHGSTGQTPFERFTSKMECLRPAPDNLRDHFRRMARRRVAADRTVILNGMLFEGPVALIGKRVEILYHEKDLSRVEVCWEGKSYGYIRAVDLGVNCRVKRDKNRTPRVSPCETAPRKGGSLWEDRS